MHKYFSWFGLPGTMVLSGLLSLTALVLALCFRTKDRWLCCAAMFLSTIGDLFMTNFNNISEKLPVPSFFVGATFFIFAHIVYIFAYQVLIRKNEFAFINPGFWAAVVFVLACGALVIGKCFLNGEVYWAMLILCMIYMCIIGFNCATIFSYAWSVKSIRSIAALGALSFFLSDLIIGVEALTGFTTDFLWGMIWWLYPIGQFLIILPA